MRDQTHQFTTDFYVESGEQFNLTEYITYSYLAHFKPLLFHLNIKSFCLCSIFFLNVHK